MAQNKYYVVWIGLNPGVYESWEACKQQVEGWKGAVYKGFATREEAEEAINLPPENFIEKKTPEKTGGRKKQPKPLPPEVIRQALAVDAACSGNPGQMEYRAVYLGDMEEKFHFGPILGTNNIGEFLALVLGLAYLKQHNLPWNIYTDSVTALAWVRQRKCKTKLPRTPQNEPLFQMVAKAEAWLRANTYTTRIYKWDTEKWGEIPADFGRK